MLAFIIGAVIGVVVWETLVPEDTRNKIKIGIAGLIK